tara:strand:- start:125 stop:250 length:126 start_codon:yes stop_codon:yes gene_type:complete
MDFDFIVLILLFLPHILALARTLLIGFLGVNPEYQPFFIAN